MTGRIHKLVTGRSLAVSLLWALLTFASVARAADPVSGLALVRQELPHLVAAFESTASPEEVKALFGHWTSDDVEEFRLKSFGLDQAVAEHAGKWTVESVIALQEKFGRKTSGTVGEVWGVAELRSRAAPGLQVLHESRILLGTDKGKLVDGIVYEVRGSEIILHSLVEAKMGVGQYNPSQPLGFLANIRKAGISIGDKKFAPAQIFLFHGGKKHALPTARKRTLESFNVQLVTQSPKEISNVTRLSFPLAADRSKHALDLFYARITKLNGEGLERYLAYYRKIEMHRERIQELGQLLGARANTFHTLIKDESVNSTDYNGMKTSRGAVRRISLAIEQGKLMLPTEYRGLIDPLAFINAGPVEAIAMKEEVLKIQRQNRAVLENRRLRIQELGELLGYQARVFHTLFKAGSVRPTHYKNLKDSPEAVQRIYLAIKEGKMRLPEEFRGAIEPLAFIDAIPADAITMKEAALKIQREKLAVLEKQRRRIQELGELLWDGSTAFHTRFIDTSVKPDDYTLSKFQKDAVYRIYLAIKQGKMHLPEEYRDVIDPLAFIDASPNEATTMKEAALKIQRQALALVETKSRRIQELGKLLGYKSGTFHKLFIDKSVRPWDFKKMKNSREALNRIYLAIKEGKMHLPEEYRDVLKPLAFIDASPDDAIAMKEAVLQTQRQALALLENQRQRIQELGQLLGYGKNKFHKLFEAGSVK